MSGINIKRNTQLRVKIILFGALIFGLGIISCETDSEFSSVEPLYSQYQPVLMNRADLDSSIKFVAMRDINEPGKIYFKDDYIFINELYEGIHIIDNKDPNNPVNIGFIQVPGSVDIAIKINTLYVDNATDLVAIDLSNEFSRIKITKRIVNAFPYLIPPDGFTPRPEFSNENLPENTVIVRWTQINPK